MNKINTITILSENVGNTVFLQKPTTALLSEFVGFPFKGPDKSYGTRKCGFRQSKGRI